jgi:hypothetical protein
MPMVKKYFNLTLFGFLVIWILLRAIFWATVEYGYRGFLMAVVSLAIVILTGILIKRNFR